VGQFRITAQQPRMTLRIQAAENAPETTQAPKPESGVVIKGSAAPQNKDNSALEVPEEENGSKTPAQYLARISPRTTSQTLGSDTIQFEVGYQSKSAETLTTARDPGLVENLKALNGPSQGTGADFLRDKTLMTGTVIHPDESLSVRVGMASAVDPKQMQGDSEQWLAQLPAATRMGVYAGVGLQTGPVASSVVMDTALGQPRVGAGMAINLAEGLTVGVSYLNNQGLTNANEKDTLRLGAEVIRNGDTVLGANITQPLQSGPADVNQTALGLYVNTRFR
jgi:opacity protein-like surface antigen